MERRQTKPAAGIGRARPHTANKTAGQTYTYSDSGRQTDADRMEPQLKVMEEGDGGLK